MIVVVQMIMHKGNVKQFELQRMLINQHSLEFTNNYRNYLHHQVSAQTLPVHQELRKKIQHYSFLLSDSIGRGFSSVVYKAMNDNTSEQVAIKVIELKSLKDQTCRQMLQTELECMKEVKHPYILHCKQSFFTVNNCYIVTEYCSSGDLAKELKIISKYTELQVQSVFHQIYQGILHLHLKGYIHRDIKPANIFINKSHQLKIADFGFAKKRTFQDQENYNVGTPIYMSPESLFSNIYNEKTDAWSLGITLYELVYGHPPFRAKNQKDLKAAIQAAHLIFPENVQTTHQFKQFIRACLQKNSVNRVNVREMKNIAWLQNVIEAQLKSNQQISEEQNYLEHHNELKSYIEHHNEHYINHHNEHQNEVKDHFEPRFAVGPSMESEGKQVSHEKEPRISLPSTNCEKKMSKQYFQNLSTEAELKRSRKSMLCKIQTVNSLKRKKNQSILLQNQNIPKNNTTQPENSSTKNQDSIKGTIKMKGIMQIKLKKSILNKNENENLCEWKQNYQTINKGKKQQNLLLCEQSIQEERIFRQIDMNRMSSIKDINRVSLIKDMNRVSLIKDMNRESLIKEEKVNEHNSKLKSSKNKNGGKDCIKPLITLVNYFRYVYFIYGKVMFLHSQNQKTKGSTTYKTLADKLSAELSSNFSIHWKILKQKQNLFGLNEQAWTTMINSEKWRMYDMVIRKYQSKYQVILQQNQQNQQNQQDQESFIEDFKQSLYQIYDKLNRGEEEMVSKEEEKMVRKEEEKMVSKEDKAVELEREERYKMIELGLHLASLIKCMRCWKGEDRWQSFVIRYQMLEEDISEEKNKVTQANYYQMIDAFKHQIQQVAL